MDISQTGNKSEVAVSRPSRIKDDTVHMVGNAHLDPVWLWQWQEGFQEAKATFRSVLNLMAANPDFLFTSSSAAIYEWVEQNDPAMFAEIQDRVAEGRWEIAGGWWIQPDCNIPGGESFVRQGLYGQRYFAEKLGVTATVGYNPDSFGHAATLPQILRKSGMDSYVMMRPQPHEKRLPGRTFWWESPDGSRVLTYRIPYEYSTWGKSVERWVRYILPEFKGPIHDLMVFYGVGNHGGGPTQANIDSIREMNADPEFPTLLFSTPARFFARVRAEGGRLPEVQDELQMHAVGCYAAHSGVKQWNRRAEHLLMTAERWSTVAHRVTGQAYPDDFARAWKGVLFNQFHDILAGTSIEAAYDDARNLYGEALAIAGRNQNYAIQSLSWNITIPFEEGAKPIVVFNPHAWPARMKVELEFGAVRDTDVLLDSEGVEIPFQALQSEATVTRSRNRLAFQADLPAFGYHTYRLTEGEGHSFPRVGGDSHTLENDRWRLEVDPDTGALRSLYDREEGFEWLRRPAARGTVYEDRSDTWSHGVVAYADVVGEFSPVTIRRVEDGPVQSTIRVTGRYGSSRLVQDFTMYPEGDRIDVRVTVDWREHFKLLKLVFPLNLYFTTATYEIPYGAIQRPGNGHEVPGQSWVDLSGAAREHGGHFGMSVLNDAKYSFDATEHEIRMTVLRSPIYAHHIPREPEEDGEFSHIDQGIQHFSYSLLPHRGSWEDGGTVRRAAELNEPAVALVETYHPGALPPRDSLMAVDHQNVVVTVLKKAEDGEDVIVRAYETAGRPTRATIALAAWNREIEAEFGAWEIKTFRVPQDAEMPVRETNLIEWE